ncbi:hypothetical protein [uncultured Exiguobacterium sp.]|uniref:hypothetical protein n=1 Tax=uncultured Exiguobacterium sp. TaxID=202669 RepID=UPI0025E94BCF|nr:hypothetical protein [uncultured Exiguobacterium sp.]
MKNKILDKINENFKADNNKIDLEMLMGYVSSLIFSKEVFNSNPDISIFLSKVFSIEFKSYVMANRNLICAKTLRYINEQTEESLIDIQKRLIIFAQEELNKNKSIKNSSNSKTKAKKKKNANDKFDIWLKGL